VPHELRAFRSVSAWDAVHGVSLAPEARWWADGMRGRCLGLPVPSVSACRHPAA
jgi:hypothetical protein